jgi:hypothetical protein
MVWNVLVVYLFVLILGKWQDAKMRLLNSVDK